MENHRFLGFKINFFYDFCDLRWDTLNIFQIFKIKNNINAFFFREGEGTSDFIKLIQNEILRTMFHIFKLKRLKSIINAQNCYTKTYKLLTITSK